jgi:RNA exonuclease 4
VIDARATMAIYRLNRGQWEKGYAAVPIRIQRNAKARAQPKASRKSIRLEGITRRQTKAPPPSKTISKGVSSGLSTIVRRKTKDKGSTDSSKVKWWSELAGTGDGSKGHISVTA